MWKISEIQALRYLQLTVPLNVIMEQDNNGVIARTVDLPLFGFGEDALEAINALKDEIESLYNDLMEDDKFSEEWLRYKKFLKEIVVPAYPLPCHIQTS